MIFDSIKSAVDLATQVPRFREIVGVLFKYGFAEELRLMTLEHVFKLGTDRPRTEPVPVAGDITTLPVAVRIRLALEELGPTFVKFGQILSCRRDLISDDIYEELCKLRSEVTPFPGTEARKILREELGKPITRSFSTFEIEPLGSGSIAQVHRATLKDGTVVAVKIQRPNIEKTIEMDLAILSELASFLEHHAPELAPFNPTGVIREFAATLWKELDFRNEASNTERFARQFEHNDNILTPRVHRKFTTGKVLTMDYITGVEVDQPGLLIKAGIDPVELSKEISRLIFEMLFTHGFFHADPHPGNITILPGGVVALYDYGMMGNCTPSFRASVATLVSGLAERDTRRVVRAIIDMSEEGFLHDPDALMEDTHEFIAQHLNRPLKEINLSLVLNRLLEVLRKHRLRMKGSFYLGVKALSQIETVGRILNPSLNFIKLGEPYAMRTLTKRYQPKRMGVLLRRWVAETFEFLDEFPNDFRSAYHRLRKGQFSIPLEHKIDPDGFEPLRKTLDSIANRLTNAILTASILICSGLIVHSRIPPHFHEISVIGLLGLIGGGFMAARIILSIWRHGGL